MSFHRGARRWATGQTTRPGAQLHQHSQRQSDPARPPDCGHQEPRPVRMNAQAKLQAVPSTRPRVQGLLPKAPGGQHHRCDRNGREPSCATSHGRDQHVVLGLEPLTYSKAASGCKSHSGLSPVFPTSVGYSSSSEVTASSAGASATGSSATGASAAGASSAAAPAFCLRRP